MTHPAYVAAESELPRVDSWGPDLGTLIMGAEMPMMEAARSGNRGPEAAPRGLRSVDR
jgi:hypothetical protein